MALAGDRNQEIQLVILGQEVRTPTGYSSSEALGETFWVAIATLATTSDSLREAVDSSEYYRLFFTGVPPTSFKATEILWYSQILGTRRLRPQGSLRIVNHGRGIESYLDCKDITQDKDSTAFS